MWQPSEFRDLVSGRRRDWRACLWRSLLTCAEGPYGCAVRLRNAAYQRGLFRATGVAVPVISVGNLSLGGTGKTPLVEWLAGWYARRGVRVALVSRGYGGAAGPNDEALELAQRLPGTPHLQDPDRVRAARRAIQEYGCQLLLLDDAFQHRRLARDLDIVLLDALDPWGGGRVFPRGLLREPVAGLARAHVVALSRSDAVGPAEREALRQTVARSAPHALWAELAHQPQRLVAADGRQADLAAVQGQRVAAFCGIGNPAGFRHTLQSCDCDLRAFREFPDHHRYSARDLESLDAWSQGLEGVTAILCTQKDLVKLPRTAFAQRPLWAVRIGLEIRYGQAELETRLASLTK